MSSRWILSAVALALIAAALCAWGALCLLFWQGHWQLLYHPKSVVARTPSSAGYAFDSIGFDADNSGVSQLRGWWIPGPVQPRYTAIYFHGADGNLGNTVDALIPLHQAGLNVFAFDYRGYGASRFEHPSEARWREDAEAALSYLTGTRNIPLANVILAGSGLGADLALEVAAAHPGLAGLILDDPMPDPTSAIFNDPRARLVPAHLLVSDRWNLNAPASDLRIPSLWLRRDTAPGGPAASLDAYQNVTARKVQVWLPHSPDAQKHLDAALQSWLDDLVAGNHSAAQPFR